MKKLYLLLISLFIFGCAGSGRYSDDVSTDRYKFDSPVVRVLLGSYTKPYSFLITTETDLIIDNRRTAVLKKGNKINLSSSGSIVEAEIGKKVFSGKSLNFLPAQKNNYVTYGTLPYRGTIEFRNDNGKLLVINRVSIEDYLKGVLPVEMGVKNNPDYFEALKAFAITARTFALKKLERKSTHFDFYPDTRDQVYKGVKFETRDDIDAVNSTKGMVLKYNSVLATVFYHSSCGGVLEDAGNIFSFSTNLPYLNSKSDGNPPNCSISPSFAWKEEYSTDKIGEFLISAGYIKSNAEIIDMKIKSTFPSGRVSELAIKLSNNETVIIGAKEIRNVFRRTDNNGILRSLLFNIEPVYDKEKLLKVVFTGNGNGHGVGFCQWGAMALSNKGEKFRNILSLYFPNTQITKAYD